MLTVPEALRAFGGSALVVRAVGALAAALELPALRAYPNLDAVVDALIAPPQRAAARVAAARGALGPAATAMLSIANAVDIDDRALVRELGADAWQPEPQANDAALKATAIAAIAMRAFPRDPRRLFDLPSGPVLLATWAAVDVALPLGRWDVADALAKRGAAIGHKLDRIAPAAADAARRSVLDALIPRLQQEVDRCAARIPAIVEALVGYVPGVQPGTPGAPQTIAVKMDRLPIYKCLSARLAAERAALEPGA